MSLPPLLQAPVFTSNTVVSKTTPVKQISPMEMQLRREKGLCYTCYKKFTSSHKCPKKQYLLLDMEGDDHTDQPPTVVAEDPIIIIDQQFSYNALKGSQGSGTIKFKGSINGMEI